MQRGCGSASVHRPGAHNTSVQHAGCAQRQQHLAANSTRHNFVLRRTKRSRYQSSLCQNASSSFAQSPSDEPQHSGNMSQQNPPQNTSPGKTPAPASASLGQRVKRFFGGDKFDRKRLQALGLGAVASYGFVSNATYGTGLSVSWISFVKQTGGPLPIDTTTTTASVQC